MQAPEPRRRGRLLSSTAFSLRKDHNKGPRQYQKQLFDDVGQPNTKFDLS